MSEFRKTLDQLADQGMLRQFLPLHGRTGCYAFHEGRKLLNLSSNDYLGIAGDQDMLETFYQGLSKEGSYDRYGLGVASSRLLTGDNPIAHKLEELVASRHGTEKALLFNSGYHANIGIIPALCTKHDLILSDKLNHASLHDGLRIGRGVCKRFNHRDYDQLETLLERHRNDYKKALIITESVFSMDGDRADIARLVHLKEKYDCLLYIDEAHGVGLYGRNGLGVTEELGLLSKVDLLVGTFGKACGSIGAYLACSGDIYDYLVNHARSLIFATALPPVVLSWNHFVFELLPKLEEKREHLRKLSEKFRKSLLAEGLESPGDTNIVPAIIGDAEKTVRCSKYLQSEGYLVMPVRPPTVPAGTSRFRFSLTADLQWEQLCDIPEMIVQQLGSDTR